LGDQRLETAPSRKRASGQPSPSRSKRSKLPNETGAPLKERIAVVHADPVAEVSDVPFGVICSLT
jgi:hypothetical protein